MLIPKNLPAHQTVQLSGHKDPSMNWFSEAPYPLILFHYKHHHAFVLLSHSPLQAKQEKVMSSREQRNITK